MLLCPYTPNVAPTLLCTENYSSVLLRGSMAELFTNINVDVVTCLSEVRGKFSHHHYYSSDEGLRL